jgi:GNAT superfamily N-acetyltransferase
MFAAIDARSHDEVTAMCESSTARIKVGWLRRSRRSRGCLAAGASPVSHPFFALTSPATWVGSSIATVAYAEEYGLDETFEALVARVAATFIDNFDVRRERCWIAERDGEIVGSVCSSRTATRPKLRLLYVEPKARGLAIGRRLVGECIGFARRAGYRKITLWTNDVLVSARRIYQAAGFHLVRAEPHHSFGRDLVGQYWELPLVPH